MMNPVSAVESKLIFIIAFLAVSIIVILASRLLFDAVCQYQAEDCLRLAGAYHNCHCMPSFH
jgi:hypothetical protein